MNAMRYRIELVILLTGVLFSWTPLIGIATARVDIHVDPDVCGTRGHLSCQCRDGIILGKKLDVETAEWIDSLISSNTRKSKIIPMYTGEMNCTMCDFSITKCEKIDKYKYLPCKKDSVKFKVFSSKKVFSKDNSLSLIYEEPGKIKQITFPLGRRVAVKPAAMFPKVIHVPIGANKGKLNVNQRHVRDLVRCAYPFTAETSEIDCRIYPSSIKCIQNCAFGYTLENGISQERTCRFKDNKWMPSGFKECEPFVDCSITLISSGSLNCSSLSTRKAPECNVECFRYENKKAIPQNSYTCDIKGEWTPKLPFCVAAKSGLVLVKAPSKTVHDLPVKP